MDRGHRLGRRHHRKLPGLLAGAAGPKPHLPRRRLPRPGDRDDYAHHRDTCRWLVHGDDHQRYPTGRRGLRRHGRRGKSLHGHRLVHGSGRRQLVRIRGLRRWFRSPTADAGGRQDLHPIAHLRRQRELRGDGRREGGPVHSIPPPRHADRDRQQRRAGGRRRTGWYGRCRERIHRKRLVHRPGRRHLDRHRRLWRRLRVLGPDPRQRRHLRAQPHLHRGRNVHRGRHGDRRRWRCWHRHAGRNGHRAWRRSGDLEGRPAWSSPTRCVLRGLDGGGWPEGDHGRGSVRRLARLGRFLPEPDRRRGRRQPRLPESAGGRLPPRGEPDAARAQRQGRDDQLPLRAAGRPIVHDHGRPADPAEPG